MMGRIPPNVYGTSTGAALSLPNVVVLLERGYSLPPLVTDSCGSLAVTADMFEKALSDEVSTGLMDHKGDYSLNRYVTVSVPTSDALQAQRQGRERSGWPILEFESELYGDIGTMLELLTSNNNAGLIPASVRVDLAEGRDVVDVCVCVKDDGQPA